MCPQVRMFGNVTLAAYDQERAADAMRLETSGVGALTCA
jgi:hypothetical protein